MITGNRKVSKNIINTFEFNLYSLKSNLIHSLIFYFSFYKTVLIRFCIIVLKKNKGIKEINFDYNSNNKFENSLLILDYNFSNFLYFKINDKLIIDHNIKIYDIKNIEKEIVFIVYGFFQKKQYRIKIEKELFLSSEKFKVKTNNLSLNYKTQQISLAFSKGINFKQTNLFFLNNKRKFNLKQIQLYYSKYNQNDFI
jgi:hypothetical protein